ncbi:MAG: hypothetical protein DIU55_010795, partial [Bacillota bacterium]
PVHFVAVRTVRGGVAPAEVQRMLADREVRAAQMAAWLDAARAQLAAAEGRLNAACRALAGAPEHRTGQAAGGEEIRR